MAKKKEKVIKKLQLHQKDTGSVEVQIGLLTKKINSLVSHLKSNPKDESSRRGLLAMLNQRRRFLKYLEENKPKTYLEIKKKLGLK